MVEVHDTDCARVILGNEDMSQVVPPEVIVTDSSAMNHSEDIEEQTSEW